MESPHYLPPDMEPPIPIVAPSNDDIILVVRTRMIEVSDHLKKIIEDLQSQ